MRILRRLGLLRCNHNSLHFPRLTATFLKVLNTKIAKDSDRELKQRWGVLRRKPKHQISLWPCPRKRPKLILFENHLLNLVGAKRYINFPSISDSSVRPRIRPFHFAGSTIPRSSCYRKYPSAKIDGSKLERLLRFFDPSFLFEDAPRPLIAMSSFNKKPSDIKFLSTPTADTPGTALILTFPDKRYIFGNLHEGFQRANLQTRNKLLKVSDIFITGKTEWNTTGGLIGTILVMADAVAAKLAARNEQAAQALNRNLKRQDQEQANSDSPVFRKPTKSGRVESKPTLTIHGGPNIAHMLATARRFVFRTGMPVYVDELDISKRRDAWDNEWNPDWSDENIQIWKMPVLPIDPDKMNIHQNPESPLKRRFSDYASEDQSVLTETTDISEQVGAMADSFVKNQETLESVISHMFDSPWRLDKLHEMPLNKVQLPAAIFIRNQTTKNIEPYKGPMPDETNHLPQINVLVRKPWPGALVDKLPPVNPSKIAMSYIIQNHPQRGKFQPEKAKALNVPEGILWRNLATGISVKSADGQTITPDMVLEKGREGHGVAVVDLPSTEYVHNLMNRPEWQVSKVMAGIAVIIWILGPGVGQNEELQKFLIDHNHLKHIVSSQDYCPNYLAFDSSAAATLRLRQIDPSRFPILVHNNVCSSLIDPFSKQNHNFTFIQAQRGLSVRLEPALAVQAEDSIPMLNTARVLEDIPQEVLDLAQVAQENISSESAQQEMATQNLPSPDAEIICLGTGSALPSKYRNVSATLLRVPGSGSYLLDCGEDTLGQLKRIYSPTELDEILRDLKLIWISHLHADHHLGTISVIKAWRDEVHGKSAIPLQRWGTSFRESLIDPAKLLLDEKRLFVISSSNMLDYLREYSSIEDYGFSHLVPLSSSTYSSRSDFSLKWENRAIGFDRKFGEM